jgi:CRP/FNR family cyclic AMP-dependent transcriptional regulator
MRTLDRDQRQLNAARVEPGQVRSRSCLPLHECAYPRELDRASDDEDWASRRTSCQPSSRLEDFVSTVPDLLLDVPIFASLDEESRIEVARVCNCCDYEAGETLFRQGDPASAMYLVRDGEVTICIATPDDPELVVATMCRGDFFGELAMFDGSPRSATANVIRRAKLLLLRRGDFIELLGRQPKLAVAMLASIASRLRATNHLFARSAARNLNDEIDQHYTLADRIADRVAEFGGSWWFIAFFGLVIAGWMMLNAAQVFFRPFDPFPYIFLNLVLNVICAVQAPVIMMSQNRQSAKDRLGADLDYQLNLKLEAQLQELHLKVDELIKQSAQRRVQT